MARTAPVPDIPPIPGMCPSIAVLAGGGDGGGGSGDGAGDGSGDNNADGSGSGEGAEGDQRGAPDYTKYPKCGYASHPVDVVTGRAFTHPLVDLALPGPLPLSLKRMYSSKAAQRDMGLGFGWAHTFGWEVEVGRRKITVWNEQGIAVDFPVIPVGGEVLGPWGWVLRRETWGFAVDADDGLWHLFSAGDKAGKRFKLTAIQDRNKNRIALTYEDSRLVEVTDSAGRLLRVLSTKEGRIASFQVKNAVAEGRWIAFATYAYDERGRLVSATDADGFTARYAYDDDDRMTADADRTGLTFHFRYDREGRCIESWGDYPGQRDPSLIGDLSKYLQDGVTRVKGVHHCKFEYFPEGYSEVADSTQVRRFFGTIHGTLSKAVEGGGVTTASYRDDGHLLAETDALGATTSFDRDARGRIVKITDPLGRMTVVERDAAGLPIEVLDPGGAVTTMARDRYGNLEVFTDATGAITSCRYDARGLPVEKTAPDGGRTVFEYDAQGNLISVAQPQGAVWRASYDALGRRRAELDPLGAETRYAYSSRGDLIAVTDALGGVTRYVYDGEGHLTQIIDPKGRSTEMLWGGYEKLCVRKDANGNEVRLGYNLEGELVQVRNERGEVHRLEYDPAGRLVSEIMFDGRKLGYRNDALGRPIGVANGLGQKTKLTYDLAGQLVAREFCDASVEAFDYDSCGMLIGATGTAGDFRFERDVLGRIVREVQVVGGEEHSVEIAYDSAGRRVARKTSLGHTEAFERGVTGDKTRTVLDGALAIEHVHDLTGREVVRALSAGGRIESGFDPVGRLARRRAQGAALHRSTGPGEPAWIGPRQDGVTAEKRYRYDLDGELAASWDDAHGSTQYEYDPVGQLLSMVPDKARSEVFRYDPSGNLHESGGGARPREYGTGSRLLRRGDTEYRWDEDGRLAEKSLRDAESVKVLLWKYTWSAAGFLNSAVAPDGTLVEFTYDPFARRVQKQVSRPLSPGAKPTPVSRTRFVWDGDVLVHEIKTAAQAGGDPVVEERTYCFSEESFEPLAHEDVKRDGVGQTRGGWFHYINDPSGTPERLVAPNGSIACEIERTAWGKTAVATGAKTSTPIRFQGQYEDEETGLCYNRFRYYDPESGRFISSDPIGIVGGLNSHAYTLNPVSDTDPMGLARRPRSAQQELRAVGSLSGRPQADIERDLQARGFRSCAGRTGGTVWTKSMPRGQTAAVRLDPAVQRNPPSGFADEVPHAHKEIVPTRAVTRRGNYDGQSTALDDAGNRTTDRRAAHIPIT